MMLALAATTLMGSRVALAASAAESDGDVDVALKKLYDTVSGSKVLAARARGILVFPSIVKGGFIIGAQYGDGALRKNNQTVGYYNTVAASYGLQAGVQTFGYALFFMTDAALAYLHSSDGWEIGVGPSIVVVEAGTARTLTTTTAQNEIYAFIFSQKGLMAGVGLQGSKITKIER